MPKVTARRQEHEELAKTLEDFLRNETDRLPFEMLNDMDRENHTHSRGDISLWNGTATDTPTRREGSFA